MIIAPFYNKMNMFLMNYLKKYPVSGELAFAIRLRGIRPAR